MPTGYSYPIEDGCSFEEYVWGCARAFGALVSMREEPNDAVIPGELQPNDYDLKGLEREKAKLCNLRKMTPDEAEQAAHAHHAESTKFFIEQRSRNALSLAKYQAMLAKVEAWRPPSRDHMEMKKFMADQIKLSIRGDCDYVSDLPGLQSASNWLSDEIKTCLESIERYGKNHREEVVRTNGRNEWIRLLRESVPQPAK